MYCPKCGTENSETNKFCRACRENLKVVSQAMKQRLPVVLASRFDQTTNELELAPTFSVAESTTRRLEPLTAAEKRSGELL